MELSPVERLQMFIEIHCHKKVKVNRHVYLLPTPGWIMVGPMAVDIRGVGYPARTAKLKLWKELHEYFNTHVEVAKEKHGLATKIIWQGRSYVIDYTETFKKKKPKKDKVTV